MIKKKTLTIIGAAALALACTAGATAITASADTAPVAIANAVIAAGCVVLAALISVLIYKESLNVWQWIGIAVGVAALVFLNI